MSSGRAFPTASGVLLGFGQLLRAHGFLATPEQNIAFLEAVRLLGPNGISDIRNASRSVFGPMPERREEFEALFRAHFLGHALALPSDADPEEETEVAEDREATFEPPDIEDINEAGQEATTAESRGLRALTGQTDEDHLRRFRRRAGSDLPRRISRRQRAARRGAFPDLRRTLRQGVRYDGDILTLPRRRRRTRQRPILLLIDISGSMKELTDTYFRFAHTLMRVGQRVEVFTLGTRLTRVTKALALRNREQALTRASALVSDWDGGTRLGDAMAAYLAVPRFAGFARGALVVTLSDGLERDGPERLAGATRKLSRLCWKHVWLTPLATDADFTPQTAALQHISDDLDHLGSGASIDRICTQLLNLERAA